MFISGDLPFRGPRVPEERLVKLMNQTCPDQLHPKLFFWAMKAGVNTKNNTDLMQFILLSQGRSAIRSSFVAKESREERYRTAVFLKEEEEVRRSTGLLVAKPSKTSVFS